MTVADEFDAPRAFDRYARALREVNAMTDKTFGEEIFPDHKLVTMPDGRRVSVRSDGDSNDVLLQQTEDGHHTFVDAPKLMPHPFTVGAQVELKSGGPIMTVEALEDLNDEIVHLVWFVGGTPVRDTFHCSMLKPAGVVLEKRPVAWRDRRTGIIYIIESDAYLACEGNDRGNVEGLYLRDGT